MQGNRRDGRDTFFVAHLFGEAKWTEKLVGIDVYETLLGKAAKVAWGSPGRKEVFCLFSKKGYTEAMLTADTATAQAALYNNSG